MAKRKVSTLLDNSNITQDLKKAYTSMLLSKGYSKDEIKILDDYVFIVRKKCASDIDQTEKKNLRNNRKRSLPKSLVCLTSKSEAYNRRDHTLYSLNGSEPLTKGRLIWSIIRLYQRQYNPTYEEVNHLYNFELKLLRLTVIDVISLDALRPDKQKRYYYHDEDLLESKDGVKYAVSNQWSIDRMEEIISFARSNGWNIEVLSYNIR